MHGLHLNGWVIYSVLALYILLTFRANLRAGVLRNGWLMASTFVTPSLHVAAVTLVAPTAWRLRVRGGRFLAFVQRLFAALACTEAMAAGIVIVDWWLRYRAGIHVPWPLPLLLGYLAVVGPTMTVAGGLVATRANAMDERNAIQVEVDIAKTRLLQSQLHPHVLFNALNGLAELIHRDPPAAEESVKHLADLLRRILRASESPTFSLGEERALVEDYLYLEGLRLGVRLRLAWDWDPGLDVQQVPPLLLQPLVENAIKHGIAPHRSGGDLLVRVGRKGPDLKLEVWNTGNPFLSQDGAGIGLRNLEARLALHYGGAAAFTIGPDGGGTLASIGVPADLLH